MTQEEQRLVQACDGSALWKQWGPYLSERAWGTVREDYSPDGDAWNFLPHDHARSKAYRWNEDGIGGICDDKQYLCFALALWNGRDPILKERLFGLSGPEGNHGEDVKDLYYYLDSTPTHSYLKFLYKYPQAQYPYAALVEENGRRSKHEPEFELLDTGIFDEDRYFDVLVEYAKAAPDDVCVRITATNRGPSEAYLNLIPTLWFRNTWAWDAPLSDASGPLRDARAEEIRPTVRQDLAKVAGMRCIRVAHPVLGGYVLHAQADSASGGGGTPQLLFTENETNNARLYHAPNPHPFVKDGINEAIVKGDQSAVNPDGAGTKVGVTYGRTIGPGASLVVRLRLRAGEPLATRAAFGDDFEATFAARLAEADAFYAPLAPPDVSEDTRAVQRQAFAGLLWSKQFYHYDVRRWLRGDPAFAPPPAVRRKGRNADWEHVGCVDVLSLPDKWEYPWFAAWDTAFHAIPLALVDPDFAKQQLHLLCRERYMHPNGQIPAYEWALGDVNPPVHAWAALRVYQIERKGRGLDKNERGDTDFLERVFHKLLLNFTWWVNRKDVEGNNIFAGGFLGLDNIGVFDRSAPLPTGGTIDQSDGTSWMAMYCLNLLAIALELARWDPTYQELALKFAQHFIYIAHAMTNIGDDDFDLWDDEDGFFYDVLRLPAGNGRPDGTRLPLRVRSMVGLIPLLAVEAFDPEVFDALPVFKRRLDWFLRNKPDLSQGVAYLTDQGQVGRGLFSIVNETRLRRILSRLLDENEFLGSCGVRALSRYHKDHPYILPVEGEQQHRVDYEPGESSTGVFGGNSNWRGPIWWPVNYLLIESLQRYDYVFGPTFTVEFPTGSGEQLSLGQIAGELSRRLTRTFLRDEDGRRPVFGRAEKFQTDPHFRDHLLFYEYFHGDTGAGLGASHQTGWTALVAKLIQQSGE